MYMPFRGSDPYFFTECVVTYTNKDYSHRPEVLRTRSDMSGFKVLDKTADNTFLTEVKIIIYFFQLCA